MKLKLRKRQIGITIEDINDPRSMPYTRVSTWFYLDKIRYQSDKHYYLFEKPYPSQIRKYIK